jgi:CRP/FNR family transcriptional regulator
VEVNVAGELERAGEELSFGNQHRSSAVRSRRIDCFLDGGGVHGLAVADGAALGHIECLGGNSGQRWRLSSDRTRPRKTEADGCEQANDKTIHGIDPFRGTPSAGDTDRAKQSGQNVLSGCGPFCSRESDSRLSGSHDPRRENVLRLQSSCYKPCVALNLTFLLKTCRLFSDLDPAELESIEQMASRKEFRKGQLIFGEGDATQGFFLVASGGVKIFRVGPDGRERVLHVVEANESFAEAALFMEEYPASAQALASTTVLMVDKNQFRQLLSRDPKLSFKIMGALVKWLAHMRNALTDLSLKEVPARFASYVLSLPAEPGQPIKVSISKTTIAQMLGTTKETFSRMLHRLAQHRVLTYRGSQIRILNRKRLEKIAVGDERI